MYIIISPSHMHLMTLCVYILYKACQWKILLN